LRLNITVCSLNEEVIAEQGYIREVIGLSETSSRPLRASKKYFAASLKAAGSANKAAPKASISKFLCLIYIIL
jgi:hypothetical protein